MQKSYRYHGRHKWFINKDSVLSGKISVTHINARGLIHGYTMFVEGDERHVHDVLRTNTFDDREKALKELFQRKLKGKA